MRKPFFALNLLCSRSTRCAISFIFAFAASFTLASCTTILTNLPGVYTVDVQQGNMVDQTMIDQLRPGMNKRQVLYVMGSPMLVDFFHLKRWDYLYSVKIKGQDREQKRISLYFNDDQLVGVQGDFRPSSVPVIKPSEETTVDLPKRDLEKSLWEKITGLFGYDGSYDPSKPNKPSSPTKPAPGSVSDQLPL